MKFIFSLLLSAGVSGFKHDDLVSSAKSQELMDYMTKIRRDLHQNPELSYEEFNTSKYIQDRLTELGISFTTGWGKNKLPGFPGGTGVVAHIGTGKSPCVALRADIDALAIKEEVQSDFMSKTSGKMHACGHDGHMAMLLGAAKLLKAREHEIPGTIRLMFQPAEEGGAGALMMIQEGVLDIEPRVDRVFGLHQMPYLPGGQVFGRAGAIMAGSDFFWGDFTCRGGHGAMPHLANDPVIPLASFIQASQTIVSRNINPLEAGVVSITKIEAADQMNVISERSKFGGTFRSFTAEGMNHIKQRLNEIGEGIATAHGCKFKIDSLVLPYIPTVNNAHVWEEIKEDLGFASSNGVVQETEPIMPGEDFSFFLRERPGVFMFLGSGSPNTDKPLHSPQFQFLESVMPNGALMLSGGALTQLERLNRTPVCTSGTCSATENRF